MDENATIPPTQNIPIPTGSGVTPPLQPTPIPPIPVQNIPVQQNVQPENVQSVQSPAQTAPIPQASSMPPPQDQVPEGPRITLNDLYGPSAPVQQPVQQVSEPLVVPSPSVSQTQTNPTMHEIPQQQSEDTSQPIIDMPPSQPIVQVQTPVPEEPLSIHISQNSPVSETVSIQKGGSESFGDSGGFHLSSILKFVVGGIIVLLLLLLVWGIGSFLFSAKSGPVKVTLNYWGLWEDPNVMQAVLADFQKQNPNITVQYTKQDPKQYVRRLLTRMQDGTGPDIFRIHNSWVYPLQSVLLPLPSSVVDTKLLGTTYPPVVTKDIVANGAVYGLPLHMDTLALFVNTDILTHAGASVPTTWDNFITTAKALTVKDPSGRIQTSGASIGTFDNITHAPDVISLLLLQNGANVQKLSPSQNTTDALTFYTSFARPDGNVWDTTLDNSLLAFSKGKVAMYFGYSYDIFAIRAANPNLHFAISTVPHLPGRDMTIASYWLESTSSKSKHPKESLQLLQYLSQKDIQTRLYTEEAKTRSFGELYARLDLADQLKSNPLLLPFISQYKNAVSSFFAGDTYYDEYNGALNVYLGNAINSILKDTSADSAAATLSQGVTQVTSQYAPKTQQ